MEELLETLKKLYEEKDNSFISEEDGWTYFKDECVLAQKAMVLCDELLITSNGQCDWKNISILRDNGYHVFPGEKDSFGWLIGCVERFDDHRTLCYG